MVAESHGTENWTATEVRASARRGRGEFRVDCRAGRCTIRELSFEEESDARLDALFMCRTCAARPRICARTWGGGEKPRRRIKRLCAAVEARRASRSESAGRVGYV